MDACPQSQCQHTVSSAETVNAAGGDGIGDQPRASLLQRLVTLGAVIIPILGLAAAIVMMWQAPFHWTYLFILAGMYLLTILGIGVGFHRLFTHRSFETGPVAKFLLAVMGSMAVEGAVLKWVAFHRMHHQHTDVPGDPHSPHVEEAGSDGPGIWGILRGVWHAHAGWFFEPDPVDLDRYVPDLRRDPVVRWVSRTFVLWVIAGLLIPAALGGLLTWSWWGVLMGFLWGGLVRVLLVHHVTWCINSVCHLWGSRPFRTDDESRDNPVLGILAMGEGWHNTHHAFPASARHGLAWWKVDVNYLVIRALQLLHIARNVRLPKKEQLRERRRVAALRGT